MFVSDSFVLYVCMWTKSLTPFLVLVSWRNADLLKRCLIFFFFLFTLQIILDFNVSGVTMDPADVLLSQVLCAVHINI